MMARFSVLASGSSGNAAFVQVDGFGLLIDAGVGPRLLSSRLAVIGLSIKHVHAVLLTHTHTDHWKERTLAQLRTHRIQLYCHAAHFDFLAGASAAFETLRAADLVRQFAADVSFELPRGLRCLPVPIPHDSEPTFGFRIDGGPDLFGDSWSLGYAADLGTTPSCLLEAFRNVNALALEFNHDEEMEKRSGRPWHLIQRVLGDRGHLSNRQAAATLHALARISAGGRLRHVIQLHLSRQCNRQGIAHSAAAQVLSQLDYPVALQTARQDELTRTIELRA
jgi:phosphoribosyl 1,2-cyclic phosphodiesterase